MDFFAGTTYRYHPDGDPDEFITFMLETDDEGNMYYRNTEDGSAVDLALIGAAYVEEVEEPKAEQ